MENSRMLLEIAINMLNESTVRENQWAIGGGTVLAKYFHHRISKDIDVFIDDIQSLASLSPRLNDQCEDIMEYKEQTRYISLTFPYGKIDFIASPQLTKFSPSMQYFYGLDVPLEDAVEIVCKKVYFRGDKLIPRDLFDLAVVYNSQRKTDLISELIKMQDKVEGFENKFIKQILQQDNFTPYSISYTSMLLPYGYEIAGREIELCNDMFNDIKKQSLVAGLNNKNDNTNNAHGWEQQFKTKKTQESRDIENPSIRQDYLNYLDAAIKSVSQIPTQQSKEEAFVDYMKKRLLDYYSDEEVAKALGIPYANDLKHPKP